jgi:hypothetical protein
MNTITTELKIICIKQYTIHSSLVHMKRKNNPCTGLLQEHTVPGDRGCQVSRQLAHEGGEVVSPTHRPPLLQDIFPVLITVTG